MSVNSCNEKWCSVGRLIKTFDRRNIDGLDYPFYGINKDKAFMPTVADTNNLDNTKYKIVEKGDFVFSGMQTGRDVCIRIALYDKEESILLSPAYTTFRIKDENKILPQYLFIQFNRLEMDRYGWFLSDGSIRSNLDWDRFCEIEIPLPSIEIQKKLVATYNGLKSLAEQNEALIEPLSKACEAFIVDCKAKYSQENIGKYIEEYDERNSDGKKYPFYGINKDKTFMHTVADTNNLDNSKYKIVNKGNFVFSGMQTGRDICIRIALYSGNEPIIISPAYTTFKIKDCKRILPQYLFIQFKRYEMDRYGWFLSDGSIRSNLDWDRFCDIKIPLPPLEVQQSIVDLYKCLEEAKKIASEAREKLKTLCPALVQRAANS